jgi:PAS domain S-box-containing protein
MTAPIRVLHVDDDPDVADLTATFLAREIDGMAVETTTGAVEGLDRIRTGTFDCVVSDYDMPGMDGIEFLEAVRETDPDLPFILYTAKGSETVASDAISAGVTDYLQKEPGTEQYELLANRIRNAVERTRAERARKRHLEAIETAREGISILDDDGEFIYVNEAYAELYGYDPEEMIGEHWALIYPDEEVETVDEEVLPLVEERGYWHGETTGLRADGTTFPEDHVLSLTDRGDLVCTVRDLSDRRDRQAELRLKNRVLEEVPIGITIAEPGPEDNPLIYVNDHFEDLTGYDAGEILGEDCRFLQGPDTREEPVAAMREAIRNGEHVTVELRNYRADGTEFWNRVTIAPLLDDDGTVENWVGFQEDVTERKERERDRSALEHGIEHVGVGVATYDDAGQIQYANEQYAALLGTTRSELVGSHIWEVNPEFDAERFDDYWDSYDLGETRVHETVHERFDTGERIPTETTTTYVQIDDAPYHIGTITDITESKAHEEQLQREIERLDKFASIVSHDLRNPLNVAQGHLELIESECDSDHISPVRDALGRMNDIITDTLTLARQGRIVDETEPVSLREIAEKSWQNAETDSARLDIVDDPTIRADPQRLRSILENLFRNAAEHGSTSPRSETHGDSAEHAGDVTVHVGSMDEGFYVADDGPGIPEADRESVFEAGYSTADGSSGFGLTIVREIAAAHGWEVRITDSADGGARFEFTGVEVES